MQSSNGTRQVPRVILRKAIDAQFDGASVLVLELGVGGAKFEHDQRMDIGRQGRLACGDLVATGVVRHSILLPAQRGVVFHTGIAFTSLDPEQTEALFRILIAEAQEQVKEWEANLGGAGWKPSAIRRSAVAHRYFKLQFTESGWQKSITSDPNQPVDGVTVIDDIPADELRVLCVTYEESDDAQRELLRRMATLAILERMHG